MEIYKEYSTRGDDKKLETLMQKNYDVCMVTVLKEGGLGKILPDNYN